MIKFVVCLLILINCAPTFAKTVRTISPFSTYPQPYYNQRYYPPHQGYYRPAVIPSGNLNALERYALNRNYGRENDIQRLERLENLAFGAVQSGDLNSRYRQVENAILSRPKYNSYRNSIVNTLGNYLAGQATGVTPSIINQNLTPTYNPYNAAIPPQYTNRNVMQYSSFPFGGNGYRIIDQSYGTGSGVRILD